MNKLEQLHYNNGVNDLEYITSAAEITTDVAIKFAKWLGDKTFYKNTWFDENNHSLDETTTQDLFEEFINNHYGK
jgi:hypothetical protein